LLFFLKKWRRPLVCASAEFIPIFKYLLVGNCCSWETICQLYSYVYRLGLWTLFVEIVELFVELDLHYSPTTC
jgi:hypothetical protein